MRKTIAAKLLDTAMDLDIAELRMLCAFNEHLKKIHEDKFRGVKIYTFNDDSKIEISPFTKREILWISKII